MSANIKASTDGTQAIIGVGGVDQMTVSNAGVVTANSFVGAISNTNVTATGSTTARTLANRFADVVNVLDFGADPTGVADSTSNFQLAATIGGHIFVPKGTYKIIGQVVFGSNTTLDVSNGVVLNMDCSGENGRGLYFKQAINSGIRGDFIINALATTLGSDGSKNSCIQLGNEFYEASPTITRNCFVEGNIEINISGALNVKGVYLGGWVEDTIVSGVTVTGQTNYAITAHWSADQSGLPTATWHAHNITVQNCKVYQKSGFTKPLRAFTFAASGRVTLIDCYADTTTLTYNLFVGDFGYTYAQNITNQNAYDFNLIRCASHNAASAISCDALSAGVSGSPIWNGSTHNASVIVTDCSFQKTTPTPDVTSFCIAATSCSSVIVKGSRFGDYRFAIDVYGTNNLTVIGNDFYNIGASCLGGSNGGGLTFSNNWIHDSGTTTTSTNIFAVNLDNFDNSTVSGNRFGLSNNFRYLVYIGSSTNNSIILGNKFESINSAATNAAAIFRDAAAQNLFIWSNTVISPVELIYPLTVNPIIIASGAITCPSDNSVTYVLVDTEGGAATDDLVTINGGFEGQIVYFSTTSSSRDVTFKDGTGNLNLVSDFVCDNNSDTITLIRRGSNWFEIARSNNT
jgi:hypothetical protein